ncbi:MAG: RNase adapter RapZ [Propionibacteriaceae bacterium]|nr:RNase adapter RapZ [Propionibacteriaceae bacterium]
MDYDLLANLLTGRDPGNHEHDQATKGVVTAARKAAIDAAVSLSDRVDVWIIHSTPSPAALDRYRQHGAQVHTIDPGREVVMRRIKTMRPKHMHAVAARWYEQQAAPTTVAITSFGYSKRPPAAAHTIDCRALPNPHTVPALRAVDGTTRRVRAWVTGHAETCDLLTREADRIAEQMPATVAVGCNAGQHRAPAIAHELADMLTARGIATTITHRDMRPTTKAAKTTTERGLGHEHQQQVARLLRGHKDGTPCWWCAQPMYRDKVRNWDGRALHGDHSDPRSNGGTRADRLLHGTCNVRRKAGRHDDVRPAVLGVHPRDWSPPTATPALAPAGFNWGAATPG